MGFRLARLDMWDERLWCWLGDQVYGFRQHVLQLFTERQRLLSAQTTGEPHRLVPCAASTLSAFDRSGESYMLSYVLSEHEIAARERREHCRNRGHPISENRRVFTAFEGSARASKSGEIRIP